MNGPDLINILKLVMIKVADYKLKYINYDIKRI